MKKNIVLVGFMGSGKTSVGKRLSISLKTEFIDMDDFIEKREKMTVTQIFAEKGEPYFRGLEKELCVRFAKGGGKVIATGGGVVKDSANVKNLKEGGVIFYLKSSPEKIAENLKDDHSRPLLETGDKAAKIREMMREREHFYTGCCDVTIDAANKDPDSMAAEILSYIKETEK